jgi:hypothetical protein
MLNQLRHALEAPRKLKEAKAFLEAWCPPGVEVVVKDKSCWLHDSGMIYSLPYRRVPDAAHVPFMSQHLDNHRWCLGIAGGVYTHRSLVESWVRKYLPDASVVGFGPNDIVHPNESKDRPLINGLHVGLVVTHKGMFVLSTKTTDALALLAMQLRKKTKALLEGESIYIPASI